MSSIAVWLSGQGGPAIFSGAVTFLFGLLALIIGALVNAELNRKRDDRLRGEEAKAVAAGLYGEILLLRAEIARAANIVGQTHLEEGRANSTLKFDRHLLERITLNDPILYRALAPRLGLLAPNVVLAVTKFHADYEKARNWLPRLAENEQRAFTFGSTYMLRPARDAVLDIKPALRLIERDLKIVTPAEDPEMSTAMNAIEDEEQHLEGYYEQKLTVGLAASAPKET